MSWLGELAQRWGVSSEAAALLFARGGGRAARPDDWMDLSLDEAVSLVAAQRYADVMAAARAAKAARGEVEDVLAEVDGGEARERRALSDFADALAAGAEAGMRAAHEPGARDGRGIL